MVFSPRSWARLTSGIATCPAPKTINVGGGPCTSKNTGEQSTQRNGARCALANEFERNGLCFTIEFRSAQRSGELAAFEHEQF